MATENIVSKNSIQDLGANLHGLIDCMDSIAMHAEKSRDHDIKAYAKEMRHILQLYSNYSEDQLYNMEHLETGHELPRPLENIDDLITKKALTYPLDNISNKGELLENNNNGPEDKRKKPVVEQIPLFTGRINMVQIGNLSDLTEKRFDEALKNLSDTVRDWDRKPELEKKWKEGDNNIATIDDAIYLMQTGFKFRDINIRSIKSAENETWMKDVIIYRKEEEIGTLLKELKDIKKMDLGGKEKLN